MSKAGYRLLCGTVGTALLPLAGTASAQDVGGAQSVESAETASPSDIVVTAQRRSERLEDVPISIVTADAELLSRRGVDSFKNLEAITAGFKMGFGGVFATPALRGVSTGVIGIGQENNVALYVDGYYEPFQIAQNIPLPDVKQVAVLKGPQGTLYGRNATGGAILVETRDPSTDELVADLSLSYARFDDKRATAFISFPISDRIAISIAGFFRNSDGYLRDISGFDTAPVKQRALRTKLRFEAADTLSFDLAFAYIRNDDSTANSSTYFSRQLAVKLRPDLPIATKRNETSFTFRPYTDDVLKSYSLKTALDLDWADVTSYTMYLDDKTKNRFDVDGSPANFFDMQQVYPQKAFSQEFVATSARGKSIEWVVGANYFWAKSSQPTRLLDSSTGDYITNGSTLKTYALAGYAELTWKPTDALTFTGGARYSWEKKKYSFEQPLGTVVVPETGKSWDAISPRLVARYSLADRTNIYASISWGFKSGTFNSYSPSVVTVDPEKITAYEIGFKTASRAFSFNTAAYYYDYRNMQVSTVITLPNGARGSQLANAASSRIYGAEASIDFRPTERLHLNGAIAYSHARYRHFESAPASALISIDTGLNVSGYPQDWSGLRLVRAPDWSINGGIDYEYPIGNSRLVASASVSYQSAYAPTSDTLLETVDPSTTPPTRSLIGGYRYLQNAYALVNAQIGWQSAGDRWGITFFGENITNAKYRLRYDGSAFADYQLFGQPATYGVRLDFHY